MRAEEKDIKFNAKYKDCDDKTAREKTIKKLEMEKKEINRVFPDLQGKLEAFKSLDDKTKNE